MTNHLPHRVHVAILVISAMSIGADQAALDRAANDARSVKRDRDASVAAAEAACNRQKAVVDSLQAEKTALDRGASLTGVGGQSRDIAAQMRQKESERRECGERQTQLVNDSSVLSRRCAQSIDSASGRLGLLRQQLDGVQRGLPAIQYRIEHAGRQQKKALEQKADAAERSHTAIAQYDPPLAAARAERGRVESQRDRAVADSARMEEDNANVARALNDSLSSTEKALGGARRLRDSLGAALTKLTQDGAALERGHLDKRASITAQIFGAVREIAAGDSAIAAAVVQLSQARKDSADQAARSVDDVRTREEAVRWCDSMISLKQTLKDNLLNLQEKVRLDSLIEGLESELSAFLKKDFDQRQAAARPEQEKGLRLDSYRGKRENLLRDEQVGRLLSQHPEFARDQWARFCDEQLAGVANDLAEYSRKRESLTQGDITSKSEVQQNLIRLTGKIRGANTLITRTSRDLIARKKALAALRADSLAAEESHRRVHDALQARTVDASTSLQTATAQEAALAKTSEQVRGRLDAVREQHRVKLESARADIAQWRRAVDAAAAEAGRLQSLRATAINDSIAASARMSGAADSARGAETRAQAELASNQQEQERLRTAIVAAARDSAAAVARGGALLEKASTSIADNRAGCVRIEAAIDELQRKRRSTADDSAAAAARYRSDKDELERALLRENAARASCDKKLSQARAEQSKAEAALLQAELDREKAAARQKEREDQEVLGAAREMVKQDSMRLVSQKATDELQRIYVLIDQGKTDAARREFQTNRGMLRLYLDKDAFEAISSTIDQIAAPPPAPVQPAMTAAPPPPAAPPPSPPPSPAPAAAPVALGEPDATMFISSIPPGVTVLEEGNAVGKSGSMVHLTSGTHRMQFVFGQQSCTKTMTIKPGANPSVLVKVPCQ